MDLELLPEKEIKQTQLSRTRARDTLCASGDPVFQEEWFLSAALPKARRKIVRVIEGGEELGYLPFGIVRNRYGLASGGMTHWGHLTGPVLRDDLDASEAKRVCLKLIRQLPKTIRLYFVCQPPEALASIIREAFIESGFSHSQQLTHSFPREDPGILSRFNKKHRTHIRAAEKQLDLSDIDAKEFIQTYAQNLKAQGVKSYAPLDIAESIINAGLSLVPPQVRVTGARRAKITRDEDNKAERPLDAAIACIWDKERYYFWMTTRRRDVDGDTNRPHPDAVKLLLVRAAEHAKSLGLIFDLDGTGNAGAENFYKTVLKAPCEEVRDVYRRARIARRLTSRFVSASTAILGIFS